MFQSVTAWDWFVWAVLVVSVGLGWVRGFLITGFAVATWVLALVAVPLLAPWALQQAPLSMPVGMVCVVLFVLLWVGVGVLSRFSLQALAGFRLPAFDRLVGAALGGTRALIIVAVVAMPAHSAGLSAGPAWQGAQMRSMLDGLIDWVGPFVPTRDEILSAS